MNAIATLLDKLPNPLAGSPLWWRLAAADRRWIAGAAVSTVLVLASAGMLAWWQDRAIVQARLELSAAEHEQALAAQQAEASAKARSEAKAPWWTLLPAAPAGERSAAEQLSADVLALGPQLGVQVQRLTFGAPTHAEGAPYRSTAVQAEVRGSYADIKRWIAELLARRPHSLALKTLDLRRGSDANAAVAANAQPGSIEASIEWRLFERETAR
jgi:hypothetical protein